MGCVSRRTDSEDKLILTFNYFVGLVPVDLEVDLDERSAGRCSIFGGSAERELRNGQSYDSKGLNYAHSSNGCAVAKLHGRLERRSLARGSRLNLLESKWLTRVQVIHLDVPRVPFKRVVLVDR
jgi:hypothetical protein